jgi:hypothetical protein
MKCSTSLGVDKPSPRFPPTHEGCTLVCFLCSPTPLPQHGPTQEPTPPEDALSRGTRSRRPWRSSEDLLPRLPVLNHALGDIPRGDTVGWSPTQDFAVPYMSHCDSRNVVVTPSRVVRGKEMRTISTPRHRVYRARVRLYVIHQLLTAYLPMTRLFISTKTTARTAGHSCLCLICYIRYTIPLYTHVKANYQGIVWLGNKYVTTEIYTLRNSCVTFLILNRTKKS